MSLARKFGIATAVLYLSLMLVFAIGYSMHAVSRMQGELDESTLQTRQGIHRVLQLTNEMLNKQVQLSMKLLKQEVAVLGSPRMGDLTIVQGKPLPSLWFDDELQTGKSDFVDALRELSGANITLFAKENGQFVRVATSIVQNGQRAIGTQLDTSGLAHAALTAGQAFYGMLEVLGVPYMTAYEPIFDAKGFVIGAYYTGYVADASMLHETIDKRRLLETGFLALINAEGEVLHHTEQHSADFIENIMTNKNANWTVNETPFSNWNYRIISAYPNHEMHAIVTKRILVVLSIVGISGAILIAAIMALMNRIIVKPVSAMAGKLEEIAQGDLNVRLNTQSTDELGTMAKSFNRMLVRLQDTVGGIQQAAHQLAASATQLSNMAADSSKAVAEQTSETEQIATAMNEMSATVQEVARSTEIAAENAQDAEHHAQSGKAIMERSIRSNAHLANEVEQAAEVIDELSVATGNITQVLDVIGTIAEQTNLLALNAAIEAARAGDHGRGFSVVADEVRSLASRTQQSTAEIQQMIERIQRESKRAVDVMKRGQETAQSNVDLTRESGESLQTILHSIERISDRSTEIASAAEQQSAVAEEITRNIVRIRDIAEHNNDNAIESKQASDSLAKIARELLEKVRFFRT